MRRTVVVTHEAKANADAIYEWIANRSAEGADAWQEAYLKALDKLSRPVVSGVRAPELLNFGQPLLQSVFHTRQGNRYRLIFRVVDEEIHLLFVRGFGQDIVG